VPKFNGKIDFYVSLVPLIFPRVFSLNLSSFSLSLVVPPQTFFIVAHVLKDLTPVCFDHHRPSFPAAADTIRMPALAGSVKSLIFSRSIPMPPYFITRSRAHSEV
jgi:hypothetical protein